MHSVMMLVNTFPPLQTGGAEKQAERLAGYLGSQGWRVGVITRGAADLPAHEQRQGFFVRRIPAPGPGKLNTVVFTLGTMLELFRRRREYAILHAHLAFAPAVAATIMGRVLGKRVIVKFGNSGTYGDVQVSQRTARGRLKLAILRRGSSVSIALDSQMEQELHQAGFARERVLRMANGIDTSAFARRSDRATARATLGLPDRLVLLFVGRLTSQKALPDLLEALRQALEHGPQLQLVLVGDGPERAMLEQRARELGVAAHVTFAGAVSDIQPYLDAADIFVLPSLAEGISNALLEAMTAGLACVATRVGGTPEVLDQGRCGVLLPPGQPALLRDTLVDLARRPDERARLGAAARERIDTHYAFAVVGNQYLALYRRLLQEPSSIAGLTTKI